MVAGGRLDDLEIDVGLLADRLLRLERAVKDAGAEPTSPPVAATAQLLGRSLEEGDDVVDRLMRFAGAMVVESDMVVFEAMCEAAIRGGAYVAVHFPRVREALPDYTDDMLREAVAALEKDYLIEVTRTSGHPGRYSPGHVKVTEYGFGRYLEAIYDADAERRRIAQAVFDDPPGQKLTVRRLSEIVGLPDLVLLGFLRDLEADDCLIVQQYMGPDRGDILTKPLLRRYIAA